MRIIPRLFLCLLGFLFPLSAHGHAFELFAKGTVTKNNIEADEFQTTVSGSAGVAVALIPRVRIEARYTNTTSVQNKLTAGLANGTSVTLDNILTETSILSVGVDIDLFGDKYSVQPYLYVGAGYVITSRSYYVVEDPTSPPANPTREPTNQGLSGNLGAGIRIKLGQTLALELEAFAYGIDLHNPNPLVNLYATAGIRLFI